MRGVRRTIVVDRRRPHRQTVDQILKSVLLSCAFGFAGCAQTPSQPSANPLTGLWQYPGRSVWIAIGPDMSAFQCRIGGADVFSSHGKVGGDATITWHQLWGPDKVTVT